MRVIPPAVLSLITALLLVSTSLARADSISDNPILFVTVVPNPRDFGTMAATFGNHVANPDTAFRGGDLWIRYPDGSLKNLTAAAGYGNSGFQGASSIAVRDPSVHWNGTKAIFSMAIGSATQQYQVNTYRFQLYEITGLGPSETPVVTKLPNQPANYNNHSAVYASDDSIIFVSDRPRDDTVLNTYPQRDEYESAVVNSGLWKLTTTGELKLLDHAPSGDFNPLIDSYGRIIFSRWDHLQRDQQNVGVNHGAFNYQSETSQVALSSAQEIFPEPRSNLDTDYSSLINLFTINQFFPWMMNQDGTGLETLNHIGRQEVGLYSERSFNDDPNVEEFYGQYTTGANQNEFTIMLHIHESQVQQGLYLGTSCQEFGTHAAGQIISLTGAQHLNPDNMVVTYLTHPDTSGATDTPGPNHSGLYRDPLPLSNGKILVSHTSNTRQDSNIGTSGNPQSRYDFRLKLLDQSGAYGVPGTFLTSGINKSVNFWDPDTLVSYNGPLWEMMPVELKARARPGASEDILPSVESAVISSLGIQINELKAFLVEQNLALVVSRNVTMRDRNDRQQPTNLRVSGTSTQTIPKSGKIYDISHFQIYQGDLIRGYSNGNNAGRRVLAQHMHSVPSGLNQEVSGMTGAVSIAEDGSVAAFVPARRALTWQLGAPDKKAIVRERYWVTFQPGEIRVCTSCHGINTADHTGRSQPTNSPLALARLLAAWKNLPPIPGGPNSGNYNLSVKGIPKLQLGGKFSLSVTGGNASDQLRVKASIDGKNCTGSKDLPNSSTTRRLRGKLPNLNAANVTFSIYAVGSDSTLVSKRVRLSKRKSTLRLRAIQQGCSTLFKALKAF